MYCFGFISSSKGLAMRFTKTILALTVVALLPFSARAATLEVGDPLIPAGLGAGDTFQIMFVTSTATQMNQNSPTTTPAQFADAHVNAAANAGGSLLQGLGTWKAVASFDGYPQNHDGTGVAAAVQEDAVTRAPVFGLLVRPDGVFLANDSADLYDGDIALPADGVGPNVNELGTTVNPNSWTWSGSNADGTLYTDTLAKCGSFGCGVGPRAEPAMIGYNTDFLAGWIHGPLIIGGDNNLPFFGMSELITVLVPEPASMGLMMLGLAGMFCSRRR
jgi:hypothetical protein